MSVTCPEALVCRSSANMTISPYVLYEVGISASFPQRLVTGPTKPIDGSCKCATKTHEPTWWNDGVIVQQDYDFALRDLETLIGPRGEPSVGFVENHLDVPVSCCENAQIAAGSFVGAIVDDDELVRKSRRVDENALERHARQHDVVQSDNDDARLRPITGNEDKWNRSGADNFDGFSR